MFLVTLKLLELNFSQLCKSYVEIFFDKHSIVNVCFSNCFFAVISL